MTVTAPVAEPDASPNFSRKLRNTFRRGKDSAVKRLSMFSDASSSTDPEDASSMAAAAAAAVAAAAADTAAVTQQRKSNSGNMVIRCTFPGGTHTSVVVKPGCSVLDVFEARITKRGFAIEQCILHVQEGPNQPPRTITWEDDARTVLEGVTDVTVIKIRSSTMSSKRLVFASELGEASNTDDGLDADTSMDQSISYAPSPVESESACSGRFDNIDDQGAITEAPKGSSVSSSGPAEYEDDGAPRILLIQPSSEALDIPAAAIARCDSACDASDELDTTAESVQSEAAEPESSPAPRLRERSNSARLRAARGQHKGSFVSDSSFRMSSGSFDNFDLSQLEQQNSATNEDDSGDVFVVAAPEVPSVDLEDGTVTPCASESTFKDACDGPDANADAAAAPGLDAVTEEPQPQQQEDEEEEEEQQLQQEGEEEEEGNAEDEEAQEEQDVQQTSGSQLSLNDSTTSSLSEAPAKPRLPSRDLLNDGLGDQDIESFDAFVMDLPPPQLEDEDQDMADMLTPIPHAAVVAIVKEPAMAPHIETIVLEPEFSAADAVATTVAELEGQHFNAERKESTFVVIPPPVSFDDDLLQLNLPAVIIESVPPTPRISDPVVFAELHVEAAAVQAAAVPVEAAVVPMEQTPEPVEAAVVPVEQPPPMTEEVKIEQQQQEQQEQANQTQAGEDASVQAQEQEQKVVATEEQQPAIVNQDEVQSSSVVASEQRQQLLQGQVAVSVQEKAEEPLIVEEQPTIIVQTQQPVNEQQQQQPASTQEQQKQVQEQRVVLVQEEKPATTQPQPKPEPAAAVTQQPQQPQQEAKTPEKEQPQQLQQQSPSSRAGSATPSSSIGSTPTTRSPIKKEEPQSTKTPVLRAIPASSRPAAISASKPAPIANQPQPGAPVNAPCYSDRAELLANAILTAFDHIGAAAAPGSEAERSGSLVRERIARFHEEVRAETPSWRSQSSMSQSSRASSKTELQQNDAQAFSATQSKGGIVRPQPKSPMTTEAPALSSRTPSLILVPPPPATPTAPDSSLVRERVRMMDKPEVAPVVPAAVATTTATTTTITADSMTAASLAAASVNSSKNSTWMRVKGAVASLDPRKVTTIPATTAAAAPPAPAAAASPSSSTSSKKKGSTTEVAASAKASEESSSGVLSSVRGLVERFSAMSSRNSPSKSPKTPTSSKSSSKKTGNSSSRAQAASPDPSPLTKRRSIDYNLVEARVDTGLKRKPSSNKMGQSHHDGSSGAASSVSSGNASSSASSGNTPQKRRGSSSNLASPAVQRASSSSKLAPVVVKQATSSASPRKGLTLHPPAPAPAPVAASPAKTTAAVAASAVTTSFSSSTSVSVRERTKAFEPAPSYLGRHTDV
jgi:hypothetical protein